MTTDRTSLAQLYAGEVGRFWDRIEAESPAGYWERNMVAGRRVARRLIARWLEPVRGQTIVDAGCGRGLMTHHLAGLGARVVALDATPRFERRAASGTWFVEADLRQRPVAVGAFTAAVLQEVLEDYPRGERLSVFEALAEWRAQRIILATRLASPWGAWADRLSVPAPHPPVDTVALFRGVHLETPYFLTRRETVRRRHYAVELAEFSLTRHWPEV